MRNPKFLGVYSLKKELAGGKKPRFFVWELPNGYYAVQRLNSALAQTGAAKGVQPGIFKDAFVAEPSILAAPVTTPDFRPIIKASSPVPPREEATPDETLASLERARKAKQLEVNLRDSFDKAMRAITRPRDRKGGLAALERIANTTEDIEPSHKFMFRDFGVTLRKHTLHDLALTCAKKVVALAPHDDHARFNLARILALLGRYEEAQKQLAAAMKLDPGEEIYGRFARHLSREQEFARAMANDQSGVPNE